MSSPVGNRHRVPTSGRVHSGGGGGSPVPHSPSYFPKEEGMIHKFGHHNDNKREYDGRINDRNSAMYNSSIYAGGGGGAETPEKNQHHLHQDPNQAKRDEEIKSIKRKEGVDAIDGSRAKELPSELIEKLRNPLEVFCPYEPTAPQTWRGKACPPILRGDRFPMIQPEIVSPIRGSQRLTCPQEYIEKLQSPSWSESVDMATLLDESAKNKVCRDFIDRNKNRLWKFNLKFMNRDPIEVYHEIMNVPSSSFVGLIQSYIKRESSLNLGSSENFDKNVYVRGAAPQDPPYVKHDPYGHGNLYLNSLTTARSARNERLFNQACEGLVNSPNKRGYEHTPEYGNFSKYTAMLQSNEGVGLKR